MSREGFPVDDDYCSIKLKSAIMFEITLSEYSTVSASFYDPNHTLIITYFNGHWRALVVTLLNMLLQNIHGIARFVYYPIDLSSNRCIHTFTGGAHKIDHHCCCQPSLLEKIGGSLK